MAAAAAASIDKTTKVSLMDNSGNNHNYDSSIPPFFEGLHVAYIAGLADKLDAPTSYEGAVT